jgi:predicted O-linked N-acetylglucosamine transferase (SPINDLY family)
VQLASNDITSETLRDTIGNAHNRHRNATSKSAYVVHRLRFIHYDSYLNALLNAKVVLDTFPYGGQYTQCMYFVLWVNARPISVSVK